MKDCKGSILERKEERMKERRKKKKERSFTFQKKAFERR